LWKYSAILVCGQINYELPTRAYSLKKKKKTKKQAEMTTAFKRRSMTNGRRSTRNIKSRKEPGMKSCNLWIQKAGSP
jgi:hypothetical protein